MQLYTWHKVDTLKADELAEGKLTEITVAGKRVGLLKTAGILYAFTAACPHAGAALCTGWLDGLGRIVCPEHKYRFDPVTGRNTSGEGYKLFTYRVEVRNEDIYIGWL